VKNDDQLLPDALLLPNTYQNVGVVLVDFH